MSTEGLRAAYGLSQAISPPIQKLLLIKKNDEAYLKEELLSVKFVPLLNQNIKYDVRQSVQHTLIVYITNIIYSTNQ